MNTCVVSVGLSCAVNKRNDTGYATGSLIITINYVNVQKLNMGNNTTWTIICNYRIAKPIPVATLCNTCLRLLACWDCGFESHRRYGCLFIESVVCCQVDVSLSI